MLQPETYWRRWHDVGEGVCGAWGDILHCGVLLFGTGNHHHFHFSAEALLGGGIWYFVMVQNPMLPSIIHVEHEAATKGAHVADIKISKPMAGWLCVWFQITLELCQKQNSDFIKSDIIVSYNLDFYVSKENLWDQMYLYIPGMKILQ